MHIPALFLLLAAWAVMSFAQENYRVFDYEKVPSCAHACQILSIAELNCVPPAAPKANSVIYLDCFCRSDFLKSLHSSGAICHHVCGDEDAVSIFTYYNALCGSPPSSSSLVSSTTTISTSPSPSPLAPAPTSLASSSAKEPTSAPPTPSGNPKFAEKKPWLRDNWKYLVVAGVLILATLVAILVLALYYRHNRAQSRGERSKPNNGLIPFQLFAPSSGRPRTPVSRGSDSIMNIPSTIPASPLAAPGSVHSFKDSLKFYAQEISTRKENAARRQELENAWAEQVVDGGGGRLQCIKAVSFEAALEYKYVREIV
jgi:hypothetical protein